MSDFYIYGHYKEDPVANSLAVPYYIGKGIGKRYRAKNGRSKWHLNIIAKHGLWVKKLHEGLSEEEAHECEIFYIAQLGRADIGTGGLINLTDGGEGRSGSHHSEEVKKALSVKVKEFLNTDAGKKQKERAAQAIGKPEHRKRLSDTRKRILASADARARMSEIAHTSYANDPTLKQRQAASRKKYWDEHPEEYAAFMAAFSHRIRTQEEIEKNRDARNAYYAIAENKAYVKECNLQAQGKLIYVLFDNGTSKERFGANDLALELGVNKGHLKSMARGTYPGHTLNCKNSDYAGLKVVHAEYKTP